MKIYIAGAISNDKNYKMKFQKAEQILTKKGFTVLNPVKNLGFDYKEYIDMGLNELSKCDAICLLDNWNKSKGARLELHYALATGLTIIPMCDINKKKGRKNIMGIKRKLDELGRIVIPKEFRKQLGIKEGDYLEMDLKGKHVLVKKSNSTDKETPLKPILNCEDWQCPVCQEYVFLGEDEDSYAKPNFCSNCGQALD